MLLDFQGQLPVRLSKSMTPRDQISAFWEYYSPLSAYGAIYAGLPIKLQVVCPSSKRRLKPQSAILTWPSLKRILAGLRSRWIINLF
jgi:hypothetical protein